MGLATAIGLGVAGLGSIVSSSSSNKASKRAQQASADNNAANNALARDIYGQNRQALSPFMQRGNAAGNQINALLGLGGMDGNMAGSATMMPGQVDLDGYLAANPDVAQGFNTQQQFGTPQEYAQYHIDTYGRNEGRAIPTVGGAAMGQPGQTGQTAQEAANNAFDIFRNSTGYQFRLGEGLDALNSRFSGGGTLQSGARDRAAIEFGQNFGSNEFGNYLNALGLQQSVGAGSASALAGVGQNFAAQVTNNNNFNTANAMNAIQQRGNNNVLGNFAGLVGGGLIGYGNR